MVRVRLDQAPASLVAQSMGGIVAVLAALACPDRVERLVLTATSGGIDTTPYAPEDWRPDYAAEYPEAAAWIREVRLDLSARLPDIHAPALLVWSDADPVSPLGVGRRLATLLPGAELVVLPGLDHMFARDHAGLVATHVAHHLFPAAAA
jgi:pimeloyl-ACP methyl ester carboxylesterase